MKDKSMVIIRAGISIVLVSILMLSGLQLMNIVQIPGLTTTIKSDIELNFITPEKTKNLLNNDQKVIMLDIRESNEYDTNHIIGAISAPLGRLECPCFQDTLSSYLSATIVIFGTDLQQCKEARDYLVEQGAYSVYIASGDMTSWDNLDFPNINTDNNDGAVFKLWDPTECAPGIHYPYITQSGVLTFKKDTVSSGYDSWYITFNRNDVYHPGITIKVNNQFISSFSAIINKEQNIVTATFTTNDGSRTVTTTTDGSPLDDPIFHDLVVSVWDYYNIVLDVLNCMKKTGNIPEPTLMPPIHNGIQFDSYQRISFDHAGCDSNCRNNFPTPSDCTGWWDSYACCMNEVNYDQCRRDCYCGEDYGQNTELWRWCTSANAVLAGVEAGACILGLVDPFKK
jgi:rhodanese-related sulfurtransferase